jgi:membrane-associated PAP2 superfamily phosphatase
LSETPNDAPAARTSGGPPGWPNAKSPALPSEPIVQGIALIVLVTLPFLAFPGLDPWFSNLFYDPGTGFPAAHRAAFIWLRALGNDLLWLAVLALIAVLVARIAFPARRSIVPPRDVLFILSTLVIGPGLIVNLVLKNHWGRPRPWQVAGFGGDHPFVGVWHITRECTSNCSFVSGEASSAIWLITLVVLAPRRWRPLALAVAVVLAVLLSLNRIAMGGHFLSDTLLSWAITLTVIAAAWRLLYTSPLPWLTNERLEAGLTSLGAALRGRPRGAPPVRDQ